MEVLFVDVGFGTCNVILLGSGEAIVIDAGEQSKEIFSVLNHFRVNRIPHLVISHWHDDHVGGATGVLRAYGDRIKKIWFPPDPVFEKTAFWRFLRSQYDAGIFSDEQILPLVLESARPRRIWASVARDAELVLVSPSYMETQAAVGVPKPDSNASNATSGVLLLRVGDRRVVFGGDAVLKQWHKVSARIAVPIQAEVLAVPHHAGILWPKKWSAARVAAALDKLYRDIVRPVHAVISTSTTPGEKHPREEVVAALRRAGAGVMCTQMTARCTSDIEAARTLQSLPLVALGNSSPTPELTKPRKSSRNQTRKPTRVACAGSVLVELLPGGVTVHRLADHQAFVDRIPNAPGSLPLCRR